jgi:hypothetical protein
MWGVGVTSPSKNARRIIQGYYGWIGYMSGFT